jgi:hypothetical protein
MQLQGDSEGNEIRMPDTLLVPFWDHQTNNKTGEKKLINGLLLCIISARLENLVIILPMLILVYMVGINTMILGLTQSLH